MLSLATRQDILRKYVAYAKAYVRPKLEYADTEKIQKVYAELRRESMGGNSIPIAVRHLESLIRMAEAHARMHLREFVREEDVNVAIKSLLESFISTQKHAAQKALEKAFRRFIVMDKSVRLSLSLQFFFSFFFFSSPFFL